MSPSQVNSPFQYPSGITALSAELPGHSAGVRRDECEDVAPKPSQRRSGAERGQRQGGFMVSWICEAIAT